MASNLEDSSQINQVAASLTAMAAACLISTVSTSSDAFFAMAPVQYQPFYRYVIRRCQQFFDGYVPELHGAYNWVFSTRLCSSICEGVANKIVGPKVGFRGGAGASDPATVSWISHQWAPKVKFSTFCRQAVDYAAGLSTSLIKLDRNDQGDYVPMAVRLDDFTFSVDARNELTETRCLIKAFASTMPSKKGGSNGETYFLVEHRFFKGCESNIIFRPKNGKTYTIPKDERAPYAEYQVMKVSISYGAEQHILGMSDAEPIRWEDLHKDVQESINRNFGFARIGVPFRLPFANGCLGAWLMPFNGFDSSAPNMPFGKALFRDCFTELCEYDIYETFKNIDVHNGKGQVLTPKSQTMQDLIPTVLVDPAGNPMSYQQNFGKQAGGSPFDKSADRITMMPGDPEGMKPIINQFSLRSEDWQRLQDGNLRAIAMKVHMTPKTLSSSLAEAQGGAPKTATENESEDDATIDWISLQRGIMAEPINQMIECLLSVTGHTGNAEVVFGNIGLRSETKVLQDCSLSVQNHFMTRADAIRKLNPDLDEEQLTKKIAECEAEAKADAENAAVFPKLDGEFEQ